jgi:hypothetical protein
LTAASLFGTIISQINDILMEKAAMSKDLDNILETYMALRPRQVNIRIKHVVFRSLVTITGSLSKMYFKDIGVVTARELDTLQTLTLQPQTETG